MRAPVILHPALAHKPDDPRALMAAIDAGGEWVWNGRCWALKQHPVEAPSIPDNVVALGTDRVPAYLRKGVR